MKIACIGWGSLIWDPRELPVHGDWLKDGPSIPIEFTRKSLDGRITLVIDDKALPIQTLWAPMSCTDLPTARIALKGREGIVGENWSNNIGKWKTGEANPKDIPGLATWVHAHELDAVIWTSLKPRFDNIAGSPSASDVIAHLKSLIGSKRERAKEYIERAPHQIDTAYRRQIQAALGWFPRD